jgi:hypothetical protein
MKNYQAQSLPLSSPKFAVRLITANWGLDNSSYCAKTKFNNCFIIYLNNSKQTEAICILFVLRKKQFLVSPPAAVVIIISMASASQYDSRCHSNMAQSRKHVQIFFILTLWRHFANMNVKNPYLVSHWVEMTISQLAVSQSETRIFLNK